MSSTVTAQFIFDFQGPLSTDADQIYSEHKWIDVQPIRTKKNTQTLNSLSWM